MKFIIDETDRDYMDSTNKRIENKENVSLFAKQGEKIYLKLEILDTAKANMFLYNLLDLNSRKDLMNDFGINPLEINYFSGDTQKDRIISTLKRTIQELERN